MNRIGTFRASALLLCVLAGVLPGEEAVPTPPVLSVSYLQNMILLPTAKQIVKDTPPYVCYNPPYKEKEKESDTPYCPTKCCGRKTVTKPEDSKLPNCPGTGSPGSRIDNINYSHHHYADDYRVDAPEGCASCAGTNGASPTAMNHLPRFEIMRVHRYRDVAYPSSFGPGVFQHYDQSLQLYTTATGERFIDFFDPARWAATRFFDGAWSNNEFGYVEPADGVYQDLINNQYRSLRLYTATDALTMDHAAADHAIVEDYFGRQTRFQIIALGGGAYAGRVTRIADANDNALVFAYALQPGDDLGGSPERLWQLSTITDAYNRVATYHYATAQVAGRWVVNTIDLPNGHSIGYSYADGHLSGVAHPDSTASTFTYGWDEDSGCTVLGYDDAAAEGTHRRKQVYVTTNFVLAEHAQGRFMPTSAQLVRMVVDAAGVVSYLNIPHPAATASYVYEGGRALKYVAFIDTGSVITLAARYASSWTINRTAETAWSHAGVSVGLESGYAQHSFSRTDQDRSAYRNQPLAIRDDQNRQVQPVFDGAGNVTRQTHPDGTWEAFAYNGRQQVVQEIDRLGRVTQRDFDAQGNRLFERRGLVWDTATETVQPVVGTPVTIETWTYDAQGRRTAHTDPRRDPAYDAVGVPPAPEHRTDYAYHPDGLLASATEPPDVVGGPRAVTSYEYDPAGRLTRVVPPNTAAWVAYRYDARNRLDKTTFADATAAWRFYGSGADANLLVRQVDRNGGETAHVYDIQGRRTGMTVAGPGGTPVVRTGATTYLAGTDAAIEQYRDGALTTHILDHRHRVVAERRIPRLVTSNGVTTAKILETRTPIDTLNRRYVTVDPYGRRTWFAFDDDNDVTRVVRELVPNGVAPPGDAAGRNAYLLALVRSLAANPAYVIEDDIHDDGHQSVARIDGRGIRTAFAYDSLGRVLTASEDADDVDGDGVTPPTRFEYDESGNRTAVVTPGGLRTETRYSGRNLPIAVYEAVGTPQETLVESIEYTLTRKPRYRTDALGRTTGQVYGGCCDRLESIVDPLGNETRFAFDGNGNRTEELRWNQQDPALSLVTRFTFDALNRPLTRTRLARSAQEHAEQTIWTYDQNLTDGVGIDAQVSPTTLAKLGLGAGVPGSGVAVTNPANETSYQLMDGLGRPVATIVGFGLGIDGRGIATHTTHDGVSSSLLEIATTSPLGHITRSRADGAGRVRQLVDALGKITTLSYDAVGNQVAQRSPVQVGWDAVYTARSFLRLRTGTSTDAVDSQSWRYDLDGNRTEETDALGKTEFSFYDLRNRRTQLTDRVGGETYFAYDAVGNLTAISDADNKAHGGLTNLSGCTQYAYDARNMLVAEAFPVGAQGRTLRVYAYDGLRHLTNRRVGSLAGAFSAEPAFAGAETQTAYAYDNHDQLTTRAYSSGAGDDAFTYDTAGRLLSASSGQYATTVGRQYDAAGRLTREELTLPQGQLVGSTLQPATYPVHYTYDDSSRLTGLIYPTGTSVVRTYTSRSELSTVKQGTVMVLKGRTYDDGGRQLTATAGNNLVETRTYVPSGDQVATIAVPAVTSFGYSYDARRMKTAETNAYAPGQTFGYDDAQRLTTWSASDARTQAWDLSPVGDWRSTTRDGVLEERTHTAVHEATRVGTVDLGYDVQGNLIRDEQGTALAWDRENRLQAAAIAPSQTMSGFGRLATYRFDALGRRIAKTVQGRTTLYLPAGAQTVAELELPALPASQAEIDGVEADGTLANMAQTPAAGGILSGTVTRINFQPATAALPAGFLKDAGRTHAVRTNGLSYGWTADRISAAVRRDAADLPEFDTFVQAQTTAGDATWSLVLPNGTYPVVVVAGDALSTDQTNTLQIGNVLQPDQSPAVVTPPYRLGNFDGYIVQAQVSDGVLRIAPATGAVRAKLCFVEIGQAGATIDQATIDRLADRVQRMNDMTALPVEPMQTREFVYGSYVDEVVAYTRTVNGLTSRYYPHYNHLYSVAALTSGNTGDMGAVVEKYAYDAYGKQTITAGVGGAVRAKSAVGFDRGFTGYIVDQETGLLHARARQYSPTLGRFIGRDPKGYVDGLSLYSAYFVPNHLDPTGTTATECRRCCVDEFNVVYVGVQNFEYQGNMVYILVQAKYSNISPCDPACCMYRQQVSDFHLVIDGPHKWSFGGQGWADDPGMADIDPSTTGFSGADAPGVQGLDDNDVVFYIFRGKHQIIDVCNGILVQEIEKSVVVTGKVPRKYTGFDHVRLDLRQPAPRP